MGNAAAKRTSGFVCPVRGCPKKNNRRFSITGLCYHMIEMHDGVLEKRLKLKKIERPISSGRLR